MSKKSKKKTIKLEVQWKDDDLNLPTTASAIPQRRDRGGFGSHNRMNNYNDKSFESESDRGPWRRGPGPSSQPSHSSYNNRDSFRSNNSFRSSRNDNDAPPRSSFRNNDNDAPPRNSFRNNDNDDNASDNNKNWRDKKKEQPKPKYTLNSTMSSSNNSNPWRKDNNSEIQGRSSFGSKSVNDTNININNSFSRNSFGSRTNDSGGSKYGHAASTGSKFGSSSASKFGGSSGSKFGGSASQSKFASGGGFAASAMKKIDNGKARLSYSKNSRFNILDDKKENNYKPEPVLQAPSKNVSNRFKVPAASASTEQQAFPGLPKANNAVVRKEKTSKQMEKELKKMNEKANKNVPKKKDENKKKKEVNNNKKKEKVKDKKKENMNVKKGKKVVEKSVGKGQVNKKRQQEEKQKELKKKQQMDKKLVKKFKFCLGQNKSIEINKDTEKLICVGLGEKDILTRNENNYEKIASLLCGVIFNEKNINSKRYIDLNVMYDIVYNRTQLCGEKRLFVALVLELLSLIEIKKSALGVVWMIDKGNMMEEYLGKTKDIEKKWVMKEFDEYGLQYVYPVNGEIVKGVEEMIGNECDVNQLIAYLKGVREKQMIYTNYKILNMILTYILNKYYFNKISNDEEKNEEIAKILCQSDNKNDKTEFTELISLLHCKQDEKDNDSDNDDDDDEEDEDEDEDDDDDIDSHSLLIISNIISISNQLKNNNNGLVSILKIMELNGLIAYKTIQKYVQCDDDKYTINRLDGLSKLTDWRAALEARQARIEMEKDNEDYDDDDNVDNEYAGNLLKQRKHKTASDYETISFVE